MLSGKTARNSLLWLKGRVKTEKVGNYIAYYISFLLVLFSNDLLNLDVENTLLVYHGSLPRLLNFLPMSVVSYDLTDD